jgi:hypothetical protein
MWGIALELALPLILLLILWRVWPKSDPDDHERPE